MALSDDNDETVQKVAIAAAFHDIGIWTEATFDYLRPSVDRARAHLATVGMQEWAAEIETMILQHHKVRKYAAVRTTRLVEPFRQADWIDVTRGLRTFGLPRRMIRHAYSIWPDAGFHRFLIAQTLTRLRTHPFSPLPMMRI